MSKGDLDMSQQHARRRRRSGTPKSKPAVWPGTEGGQFRPLSQSDIERIHQTSLRILEEIGIADPTEDVLEAALPKGCELDDAGRLHFPRALIDDTIAMAARSYISYGRDPKWDMEVGGKKVYFGTSGEAINVVDMDTDEYRPSTLVDLYDFARLTDRLDNIHHFGQTVVATEIVDPFEHSMNIIYALLAATTKSFGVSFHRPQDIEPAIALIDIALGEDGAFMKRPFATIGCCPIISPLRFAKDSIDVLVKATRIGLCGDVAIAGQSGSTAPTALAGALAQTNAEMLSILTVVNLLKPGHPVNFGNWPFVTDLRTASFAGGSSEAGLLAAAVTQMANEFYDLPSNNGAGMTDAKIPDAQSGYEKGVTVAMAALAGCNSISECAGMQGSLLGCSFESLVIDNDMLGMINRAVRGIEVTDETLSFDLIKDTVEEDGAGHYLSNKQTQAMSRSEYFYPDLSNRATPHQWHEAGAKDIREIAKEKARRILNEYYPDLISKKADEKIREAFPILLAPSDMQPGTGRW